MIERQFSGKIWLISTDLNISCNGTKIKISFVVMVVESSHVEVSKEKIWSITILELQWGCNWNRIATWLQTSGIHYTGCIIIFVIR